jgi:hypothetical protein
MHVDFFVQVANFQMELVYAGAAINFRLRQLLYQSLWTAQRPWVRGWATVAPQAPLRCYSKYSSVIKFVMPSEDPCGILLRTV